MPGLLPPVCATHPVRIPELSPAASCEPAQLLLVLFLPKHIPAGTEAALPQDLGAAEIPAPQPRAQALCTSPRAVFYCPALHHAETPTTALNKLHLVVTLVVSLLPPPD